MSTWQGGGRTRRHTGTTTPFDFQGAFSSVAAAYPTSQWGDAAVIDATGLPAGVVVTPELLEDPSVATMIRRIRTDLTSARNRFSFSQRDAYARPDTRLGAMRVARDALEYDDIVSGVAEETEALAFTQLDIFSPVDREESVWNQIAGDLDLDTFFRVGWERLFVDSQFAAVMAWDDKTYTPDGYGESGRALREPFRLKVPTCLSYLDTTRVIPVGELMWGLDNETLAYSATHEESVAIEEAIRYRREVLETRGVASAEAADLMLSSHSGSESPLAQFNVNVLAQMFTGRYRPDSTEAVELSRDGAFGEFLYTMDPNVVWRHTLTRPQFERFARVRLASVFELLDAKAHLRHMDRSHLLGGANYIVLITKGTDQFPATQLEVDNLRRNSETLGMNSIVTGDHRLRIEIITPKLDVVLNKSKYDAINEPLAARLYQAIMPTQSTTDPMKVARLVAAGLEGRRRMFARRVEAKVMHPIRTQNRALTTRAKLFFSPDAIHLVFDPAYGNFLLDMREMGDLSRRTILAQFGFSAAREKVFRLREGALPDPRRNSGQEAAKKSDDEVFKTQVPFSARQSPESPGDGQGMSRAQQRAAGRRRGGTRNGGGAAPGTNQGGARQNEPEDASAVQVASRLLEDLGISLDAIAEHRTGDDAP